MRIDHDMANRIQQAPPQPPQPPREIPGEREQDGDSDDVQRAATRARPANQIRPETVGNRVDILA